MSPADYVINQFGGVRATARALNLSPGTVCRWNKSKTYGCDGRIPSSVHKQILALAKKLKLDITAEDLILGRR